MNNDNNLEFCIAGVNYRAGYATAYAYHKKTCILAVAMIITVNYQIILIIFEMVTHDDICTDMRIYVRTPVLLLFFVDCSFRLLRF